MRVTGSIPTQELFGFHLIWEPNCLVVLSHLRLIGKIEPYYAGQS